MDNVRGVGTATDFEGQLRGQPAGWDIGYDEALPLHLFLALIQR